MEKDITRKIVPIFCMLLLMGCTSPPPPPETQVALEKRLKENRHTYNQGSTDIQKTENQEKAVAMRNALFAEMAAAPAFDDWICTVTNVLTPILTFEEQFVLEADCGFFNLANSADMSPREAPAPQDIFRDSPLYAVLAQLKKGDTVHVSGAFQIRKSGKIRESSLTTWGGMEEPEFDVIYTSIRQANP